MTLYLGEIKICKLHVHVYIYMYIFDIKSPFEYFWGILMDHSGWPVIFWNLKSI